MVRSFFQTALFLEERVMVRGKVDLVCVVECG